MYYDTPQDAEDAYYDALESGDPAAMAEVWEPSDQIVCLLPMTPLATGAEVHRLWEVLFEQGARFDLQVRHLAWIQRGEVAIHLIEERTAGPGAGQATPAVYGTNIFRRGPDGWRLLVHQNSPTPPPPVAPPHVRTAIA